MTRLYRYVTLDATRRRLLREAVRGLIATRLRRPDAGDLFRAIEGDKDDDVARAVAWAIRAASRRVPGTWNCLAQARVASRMLRRRGLAHEVHVGARSGQGFEAHAWVEYEGQVLVGDLPHLDGYHRLRRRRQ